MRPRVRPWVVGLHLFELALTAGCFAGACRLRAALDAWFPERVTFGEDVYILFATAVAVWAVLLWAFQLYRFHRPEPLVRELWRLAQAAAVATAGLYALLGMWKDPRVNRSVILLFGLLQIAVLSAERLVVRLIRRHYRRQGYDRRYILIVGTGDTARSLARHLRADPKSGREVLGFVAEVQGPRSKVAAGTTMDHGPGTLDLGQGTDDPGRGTDASSGRERPSGRDLPEARGMDPASSTDRGRKPPPTREIPAGTTLDSGPWTQDLLDGLPVLGSVAGFAALLEGRVVDEVHFAVGREALPALAEPLRLCEERGIQPRLALGFLPRMQGRVDVEAAGDVPLLTFSTVPTDEWALLAKRAGDVAAAALFFAVAAWWLFPLVGLLVKLTSRGPAFFRQERAGLNGRRFTMYKFRTMVADADARKAEVLALNEMSGPVFKAKADPRITPLGRFLRRWSIDELPQLLNVLTGDMSLVGPRPLPVGEAARLDPWQRRRLSMRPGLTCLWQVGGRSEVDFARWMELDLEYIDRWSLGLDAVILLRTVPAVLGGRGAS